MAKLIGIVIEAHAKEPVNERELEAAVGGAVRRIPAILTVEAVNLAVEEEEEEEAVPDLADGAEA